MSRRLAHDILGLAVSLAICFAAAGVGGYWTSLGLAGWYPSLRKPAWTPPNWVFGPVWTLLYLAMAAAAWRVWRRAGLRGGRIPLALFVLQLALNAAWTGIFFALRAPWAAFVEVVLFWLAILLTLWAFWRVDRAAGVLIVPYLGWVSFAAALNFAIAMANA